MFTKSTAEDIVDNARHNTILGFCETYGKEYESNPYDSSWKKKAIFDFPDGSSILVQFENDYNRVVTDYRVL